MAATIRSRAAIVVFDIARYSRSVPEGLSALERLAADGVRVVSASEDAQVRRLMADRRMSERAARERIASQLPLEEKVRVADVVIDNDGSVEDLEPQVDRLWAELVARARG